VAEYSDAFAKILNAQSRIYINRGLKLVTDDGDFRMQGIPLVTANKKLLM
jgi:hypothetical protein